MSDQAPSNNTPVTSDATALTNDSVEVQARMKEANLYFDVNTPRAHSQAELDALFVRK